MVQFSLTVFRFLLDLIFPKFCLGCQKEGEWVCESCRGQILQVKTQVCPDCGRISELGKYCSEDAKPHGLSGIIVSAYYKEGPLKELIHNFKYNDILELKEILGDLMVKALKENEMTNFLITAVPLHFWRRAQRGFNQSEILAGYVADKCHSELVEESPANAGSARRRRSFANAQDDIQKIDVNFKFLRKIRRTKPQVKFSGKKRRKNLQKSFKINVDQALACSLKGKTIILIDDVTTTGTTLNECARVLRAAGARKVWGLVIAKG